MCQIPPLTLSLRCSPEGCRFRSQDKGLRQQSCWYTNLFPNKMAPWKKLPAISRQGAMVGRGALNLQHYSAKYCLPFKITHSCSLQQNAPQFLTMAQLHESNQILQKNLPRLPHTPFNKELEAQTANVQAGKAQGTPSSPSVSSLGLVSKPTDLYA